MENDDVWCFRHLFVIFLQRVSQSGLKAQKYLAQGAASLALG